MTVRALLIKVAVLPNGSGQDAAAFLSPTCSQFPNSRAEEAAATKTETAFDPAPFASKLRYTEQWSSWALLRRRIAFLFDERNVNGECQYDNAFNQNHLLLYRRGLDARYGTGTADAA